MVEASKLKPARPKRKSSEYAKLQQFDDDGGPDDEDSAARAFPACPSAVLLWPEGSASFLSRLFFMWFGPMVKLGNRTHVLEADLWAAAPVNSSDENFERFEKLWAAELEASKAGGGGGRRANILWPIVHFARPMIVRTAVLQLFSVGFQFLRPLLLQQILLLVEDEGAAAVSHENGWLLALALFLTTVADFLCSQHQGWLQYKQQVRVRAAVIGLLYRQVVNLSSGTPSALPLSPPGWTFSDGQLLPTGTKSAYSSGKITNMMDTDQSVLQTFTTQINRLWQVPLTFLLALTMVLHMLGWAGLIGVISMVLLIPASRTAIAKLRYWKRLRNVAADARLKSLTEGMQGIRIIKFMNWEASFTARIDTLRR